MPDFDLFGDEILPEDNTKSRTSHLHNAKDKKDDEFYTQRPDIDAELQYYEHLFKDKVVYCNCDDPSWSKFVEYFTDNYDRLGLKDLLTNHYNPEDGTGDFRSPAAVAKLAQSDIVVTNPPFSLFRHFITQLIDLDTGQPSLIQDVEPKRDKKFLILGGLNGLSLDYVFSLMMQNRIWSGVATKASNYDRPDGTVAPVNTAWFTNLEHTKRHEFMELPTKFDDMKREKFDNYDMIRIKRMKDMPSDYYGLMGVSVRFLLFHNPAQFEILGKLNDALLHGEIEYTRIIIKRIRD